MIPSTRLRDGRVVRVRRVRPADAAQLQAFVRALSPQARYERFFTPLAELTPQHLERVVSGPGLSLAAFDGEGVVALAQYALAGGEAEFALVVAEGWRNAGLGERLLGLLKQDAAGAGARVLGGVMLAHNRAMRRLVEKLGFGLRRDPDPTLVRFEWLAAA